MAKPLMLIFPFGFLSHYLRCILFARDNRMQYDVHFASHPLYDGFVGKEGFQSFDVERFNETDLIDRLRRFDFSWLNRAAIERVFLSQVNVIRELNPAVVVGDNCPTLRMAAEATKVRFVSLHNGYMSKYYAVGRGISFRHPAYRLLRGLPSALAGVLLQFGESRAFARIHRPFRSLRHAYGLPPCHNYLDEQEGDVNLICDFPEVFPQKSLPAGYRIVGPFVYDDLSSTSAVEPAIHRDKKTLFVNMGSTGNWKSVEFLNDSYFRRYNIVTAGSSVPPLDTHAAIHFKFISPSAILPLADLVICHGGNGIVNQCFAYGVPMLFKTAYFEQEWNVEAVERIGWGRSLDHIESMVTLREVVDEWSHVKGSIVRKEAGFGYDIAVAPRGLLPIP